MCVRVCVRVLAHQKFPRSIIYTYSADGRADETRTDGANAGDSIIYMYYRVRVSVAHFPAI